MSTKLVIFRGDTPSSTINLFTKDPNSGIAIAYSIPSGSSIAVNFPGDPTTVSLTTGGGEVTILNAAEGQISYKMTSAQSQALALGDNLALDVIVTTPTSDVFTAERVKVLKIVDRANA